MMEGPFLHRPEEKIGGSSFRPVQETEGHLREWAKKEKDRLQRAINLAQRLMSLRNAPGYQPFQKAIEDLKTHAQEQMITHSGQNDDLRVLQGRCQAYGSILALMRRTESSIENLSQQLKAVEERAASMVRADGKVVPEPQWEISKS